MKNLESECFTISRLREEFKLRPQKDAPIARTYKNSYGTICKMYFKADCVPLLTRSARPSPKQVQARKAFILRNKLKSKKMIACRKAFELLLLNPVFLDTETTGLNDNDQVIEIGVIDSFGNKQFESRIKPTVGIEQRAFEVHGISDQDLLTAPTWLEIASELESVLSNRICIIFNSKFDSRLLNQTAKAFEDRFEWWKTVELHCAMKLAAQCFGSTNKYGSISLAAALDQANVVYSGAAHNALVDAQATVDLFRAMAQYYIELIEEKMKIKIDDEDQRQAWKVGRDSKIGGIGFEEATTMFGTTYSQNQLYQYFIAGFNGEECPQLTS